MANKKPLLPTLKEKKRYIAYKVHSDPTIPQNTGSVIVESLRATLGIFDAAIAGIVPINYNSTKKKGIIRTSNTNFSKVRIAMMLLTKIQGKNIMIEPLITSGVLKKAKALL